MDVREILRALYQEREVVSVAILTLEKVAAVREKPRRGRPPKWKVEAIKSLQARKKGGAKRK